MEFYTLVRERNTIALTEKALEKIKDGWSKLQTEEVIDETTKEQGFLLLLQIIEPIFNSKSELDDDAKKRSLLHIANMLRLVDVVEKNADRKKKKRTRKEAKDIKKGCLMFSSFLLPEDKLKDKTYYFLKRLEGLKDDEDPNNLLEYYKISPLKAET
jgi:hypothetical protein